MSLVIAWVGIDTHGLTSAYLTSESRASIDNYRKYDGCQKIFYSKKFPEIIGYCGDTLFPSMVVNSLIDMVDNGLLFEEKSPAIIRYGIFKKKLFSEFNKYKELKNNMSDFELIYINKDTAKKIYPNFYFHHIRWNKTNGFGSVSIKMPDKSGLLFSMGSGKNEFDTLYHHSSNSKNIDTSRHIFHCFIETISNIKDKRCGGPPQLVGLYRKPNENGKSYGLIYNGKKYFNGLEIPKNKNISPDIEWRNNFFERCDFTTGDRLPGAQKQPVDIGG